MTTPLLQLESLVKRFGGLTATDHASLSVMPGEVHALIGPNGAGKTTLIHQISGVLASDEGTLRFNGTDITHMPMHERVLAGLARSYQITSIFRRLSVLDNVALAVQARQGSSMRFWQRARDERARYDEAAAVCERVGLGARIHTPCLAHWPTVNSASSKWAWRWPHSRSCCCWTNPWRVWARTSLRRWCTCC